MTNCLFVSDLHGSEHRYQMLFRAIAEESPDCVFLGGDLFPNVIAMIAKNAETEVDFSSDYLPGEFSRLRESMGDKYPRVFLILGNDDPRVLEEDILAGEKAGLWEYLHQRRTTFRSHDVFGYACVPPTPFRIKDWDRYDVSRYAEPGCISPEEGFHSVPVDVNEIRHGTMLNDLETLIGSLDASQSVFLLHSPPYDTHLDRAALDGKMIDHAPLDVHIGSVAVRRIIETRQPLLTLHGHVHESTRITGHWLDRLGRTAMINASHDGPELSLVRFSLEDPASATRELL
jgi:uncharacterized protein